MIENKTEVEIILNNGRSIVMNCKKCEIVTDVFGGISGIKYSGDCDTQILYINGSEIAAVVQRAMKGD